MNTANKITILRIFIVPFFIFFMLADFIKFNSEISVFIFILASLTDKLDGYIARKSGNITDFGKFLDPIADKLLVSSALILLTAKDIIPAWITVIIISRELIIDAFRLIASEKGAVIAASKWGKVKTVIQMATITLLLIGLPALESFSKILIYISLLLTVISLFDYLVKNKEIIKSCSR